MMKRHDFGDLFVLIAVADALSFTAAAAELRTSQSAVSHAIGRLERSLGRRLFERNNLGVQGLTPIGTRLVERLRPALSIIDQEISDITALPEAVGRITNEAREDSEP